MQTKRGRVVYDRKKHDFKWVDAYRVVNRGLGIPLYVDDYIITMAGLPKYKKDVTPDAAREYVCMMLILDTISSLISAMPNGASHETVLTTAYSFLSDKDKKKYARVTEIQMGRLVSGLIEAAGLITTSN